MDSAGCSQTSDAESPSANPDCRLGIAATHSWMPSSGDGPYSTIPISSGIDSALLGQCDLPSFSGARQEIKSLAEGYATQAIALVEKAQKERIALSREGGCGSNGEMLIRPNRVRLCLNLDMSRGYLYLYWRGVVKRRRRWTRIFARQWQCETDIGLLIADVHPAEEFLIRRLEKEAADIRRRWFALVRLVHYMNVAEEHRLMDLEASDINAGGADSFITNVLRRLQDMFGSFGFMSQFLRNRAGKL